VSAEEQHVDLSLPVGESAVGNDKPVNEKLCELEWGGAKYFESSLLIQK
jgi:hypothetical protein